MVAPDPFSISSTSKLAAAPCPSSPAASAGKLSNRECVIKHCLDIQTATVNNSALNVFKETSQVPEFELLATYGYTESLNQGKMSNSSALTEEAQWLAAKEVYGSCGPTSHTVMEALCGVTAGTVLASEHAAAGKAIRDGSSVAVTGQKGVSGNSMDKLWDQLKDTLVPTATIITIGGSHIYVLETLPRKDLSQPLQGVIHHSCFNSFNLSHWMNHHGGKALVDVKNHLDQVHQLANETNGLERMELFNEMFQPNGVDEIYLESIMGGPTLPPATTVWTTDSFTRSDVPRHIVDLITHKN